MEEILLNAILSIAPDEYSQWTICLNNATKDKEIYSFSTDETRLMEHISWKKNAGGKRNFRSLPRYCLQFYRLDKDNKLNQWLFLGAFENVGTSKFNDGHEVYDLRPIDRFSEYRERLIVFYQKVRGPKQAVLPIERIGQLPVVRICEDKYIKDNRPFPGFKNLSIPFSELKEIITNKVDSWRQILTNAQCIYVITDKSNGKLYVGSTYGCDGIWQRWSRYVETNGHGDDKDLVGLLETDPEYALKNFQFSVLESFINGDYKGQEIIEREKYWKNVLMSRLSGYNYN